MNRAIAITLYLLYAAINLCAHLGAAHAGTPRDSADTVLLYSKNSEQPVFVFHSFSGSERYKLTLEPDFDRLGRVITLTLALCKENNVDEAENLLATVSVEHGYQKYIFAAVDFVSGQSKSLYGETRKIYAKAVPAIISVHVSSAVVVEVAAGKDVGYSFSELTLEISVERSDLPER